ncbi:hypothetical protein Q8F55_008707 [Vanrija albida]|uniref:Cryptic loci regulator 2 N-terminal domain-containing protein n=1 Tax=Vanrija albida TaxID=181172 RepID=A0ABR3PRK6_9TREE
MAKPVHAKLVWARSDGSKSTWPEARPVGHPDGWYEKIGPESIRYKTYMERVGLHLAKKYDLGGIKDPKMADFPEGYALFVHHKIKEDSTMRDDYYLYGSKYIGSARFRSVPEFLPHVEWLQNTNLSFDTHKDTCNCKYGNGRSTADSSAPGAQKRSATSKGHDANKRSKPEEPDELYDSITVERAIDHRSGRRFRRGELVFFKLDNPVQPPPNSGNFPLTHWPGLIASIKETTINNSSADQSSAAASAGAAWSMYGGTPPKSLQQPAKKKEFIHTIRPLGWFKRGSEVKRRTRDVLPWAAGSELFGGAEGWKARAEEYKRVLGEAVKAEAAADPPKPQDLQGSALTARWQSRFGERIPFSDMPATWDGVVIRASPAIEMAETIAGYWAQTDKIEVVPGDGRLNAEDHSAIVSGQKTLFQGVWYQGERIWLEDMVRLRLHRSEIPTDNFALPRQGALENAVFMQIRVITLEPWDDPNNEEGPGHDRWRCLVYGDLFELIPKTSLAEGEAADAPHVPAPPGHCYRRINTAEAEISVDLFDVAGRCYPDLLDNEPGWFCSPKRSADQRGALIPAGSAVQAIVGLHPNPQAMPLCEWREDLYTIVKAATTSVDKKKATQYADLLHNELGLPRPAEAPSTPRNGANGGA